MHYVSMFDHLLTARLPASTAVALTTLLGASCSREAPARPQIVLHIDMDMPTTGQVDASQPSQTSTSPASKNVLALDAGIDTLRVEVFTSDKKLVDSHIFSVSDVASLPLSFGIATEIAKDGHALVRIRAFRAEYTNPGQLGDIPVLDPLAPLAVDRLVAITLPSEGIVDRSLVLHGDCMGLPVKFGLGTDAGSSCVDVDHVAADPGQALDTKVAAQSVAGTWSRATEKPCVASAPSGSVCIPGGLSVFGDPLFLANNEFQFDASPVKLVDHSPFFIDKHEVTVGELRALVAAGYQGPLPDAASTKPNCTWDPATDAEMPVNCISYEAGDAICAAKHGTVPSEAQWEHAARGRGQRRLFAWGNTEPDCCSASIARVATGGCQPFTPEPVESHLGSASCAGDVTLDGVEDMTGSVAELLVDYAANLDDPCWTAPGPLAILVDPVCADPNLSNRMAGGASWGFALGDAALPIRRTFDEDLPTSGLRCVYKDTP